MAIKSSGQITIVDLSDARQLSAYIASNLPKVQVYDPNTNIYAPTWGSTNLVLTPSVFLNQSPLALSASGLTISWKRKDGAGSEVTLLANETVSNGILTVNANKLADSASGLITYICYLSYLDSETKSTVNISTDISFSLVKSAINAKTADISGEQIFKYDKNNTLQNAQIALTATVQGVMLSKWQYKNSSGSFIDYPTTSDNANITSTTLIVKPAHSIFVNNIATLRLSTNDANISDIFTIYKIYDGVTGATGTGGITVFLSNETQVIPCNSGSTVINATSIVTQVMAYQGTTAITPTVTTPTGLPSGMTCTQSTSGNIVSLTFNISAGANLGGTSATFNSGTINIPISAGGQSITKIFSWAKGIAGATGSTGSAGVSPVVFSIYAPNGTVVYNGSGALALNTSAYKGITEVTSGATYQWAKLVSGSWSNISGATLSSLTVSGTDIVNILSYRCTMTYESKTYVDVITLEDKSDSMVATIIALGGTVFKNSIGSTPLVCKLFSNGIEVDELKSTTISPTAPSSPIPGTFWYEINTGTRAVTLKKYSGTAWANATGSDLHTYTYKWYRYNSSGVSLDNGAVFGTGKVIYINDTNVDGSTNFVVEVE